MDQEQIEDIRERMEYAYENWEFKKRVSIKQMAEYLTTVHPELYVVLNGTSCYKDTKVGRMRFPGEREYTGYRLKVWRSKDNYLADHRYPNLINHDTTETYRRNYEVARKIIQYEREKAAKKEANK